jgi:hypothetical protein
MARGRCTFRQSDVTRTVRAVVAAGLKVIGVNVAADGKIEVVTGEAATAQETPLDTWMAKHGSDQA